MSTSLTVIAVGALVAFLCGKLPKRWRLMAILIVSSATPFLLQSALPIPYLDFILPSMTIMISIICWALVNTDGRPFRQKADRLTLAAVLGTVLMVSLMRYVDPAFRLTPSRPPETLHVLLGMAVYMGLLAYIAIHASRPVAAACVLLLILVLFIIFKTEAFSISLSAALREQSGRNSQLASSSDLLWLGYSFLAFRLIHTLRDARTGILPAMNLAEYLRYVLFFPAFIAGPIDRAERFIKDERQAPGDAVETAYPEALIRIARGLFLKFVLADTLGQGMALSPDLADQVTDTGWSWLLLYGYGLRLYADFAAYTDIAIGIGLLLGIRLPENFRRPYRQLNITAFWQSWHITLSTWVRSYVFTPLSRTLLKQKNKPSTWLIVLSAQLSTMILIGLWHGISLNFLIWGIWHAAGLFVHKQWSDRTRSLYRRVQQSPVQAGLWRFAAWFLCLNYVMLGWVWFVLSDTQQALRYFGGLFGWQS